MKKLIISSVIFLLVLAFFKITLFVVQPMGAVPEGENASNTENE
ncbi:hypothetical protein [Aeromonas salmonicida]